MEEKVISKDSETLAQKMAGCNVETLNVTELAVVSAIKKGANTVALIEEETTIKANILTNVLETLVSKGILIAVPGSEEDTYVMKVKSNEEAKRLRLGGNLLLPVSSFHDKDGQRWVCRGSWHKIEDDVDILNDIEWFDNSDTETQMKTVMKTVTERKKKQSEAKAKNDIASDGPAAAEDEQYIKKWNIISDEFKMYVYAVSANRATVGFSARIITPVGEFPFGCISETQTISIDEFHSLLKNEGAKPKFDYNKILVITGKNNFPAEIVMENDTVKGIKFYELKPNRGGDTIAASEKMIVFTSGKFSVKNGKNNVDLNPVDVPKFVASDCPLIDGIYKEYCKASESVE